MANGFLNHYCKSTHIRATPEQVFAYLDNHERLSAHMNKPSWMMGGGSMVTEIDEGHGQKIGSHIRLSGSALGIPLSVDEVVTLYEPPFLKTWETVGTPKLLVIGRYRMGIEVTPHHPIPKLRVFIDYDPPKDHPLLGRLFGKKYAIWCVHQMLNDVKEYFREQEKHL